ncbi:hypothetical protein LMG28614_07303 [Paraburkholderia ultramafica]|uniref:Uncharacterized protein n=1 Tax=Paraburkholderia ultramafica TaxID=1544867 RepID=A0A6S7D8A0_9BURK|nr:hypothetical protein LMG28614_07303 [Paraburkholderia ultramafica]
MLRVELRGRHLRAVERRILVALLSRHEQRTRHLPAAQHDARELQIRNTAGEHRVRIALRIRHDEIDHRGERTMTLCQIRLHRVECRALLRTERLNRCGDAGEQRLRHLAAVAHGLAADQVIRLDRRRTFVDRQDARVAVVLRGAGFFDEAHAAMHLHAETRDVDRQFRAPALHDRHEELVNGLMLRALRLVGVTVRDIAMRRGNIRQRA